MATPLKVLVFDIETAPLLAYIWQAKTEYVAYDFLEQDFYIISWAAKWRGEEWLYSDVLTPKEAREQDDTRIVDSLADMVREADIVLAHNGDYFDVPKLNARLVSLGAEPMGSKQTIDTKTLSARSFKLAYNKLDYLGDKLVGDRKIDTGGFELWRRCFFGEQAALDEMLAYNEQDVILLEEVFEKMLPYVKRLPRLVEPEHDGEHACPFCGGTHLTKRGYHRTNTGTYQKYQCGGCLRYSRVRTAEKRRLALVPA